MESKHMGNIEESEIAIGFFFPGKKSIYRDNWSKWLSMDLGAPLRLEYQPFLLHTSLFPIVDVP